MIANQLFANVFVADSIVVNFYTPTIICDFRLRHSRQNGAGLTDEEFGKTNFY